MKKKETEAQARERRKKTIRMRWTLLWRNE